MDIKTKKVPFEESNTVLDNLRTMSKEEFIENHGSGTLRKNTRLGMNTHSQYLEERIAYEFGWEFMMAPTSRVQIGATISEGDCHSLTELGWHAERYMARSVFKEDKISVNYITFSDIEGNTIEGNGLVINQTSYNVPENHVIFAIVSLWNNETEAWEEAANPF